MLLVRPGLRPRALLYASVRPDHTPTLTRTRLGSKRSAEALEGTAAVSVDGGRAWPGFETTRRAKLAARTASGRAAAPRHQHADKQENTSSADGKQAAHGADGKQAGLAGGSRRRRRAGSSRRGRRVGGPSGRAAAPRHQHAEHAHTTRPGPAAPYSAGDPGLVKQSDQAVHHEGGECFERGLDLALGQRCERCDSVVGPGAREFARLIEHVVGAQAFHDRGEGLVGG